MQSVPITTKVVSLNVALARSTQKTLCDKVVWLSAGLWFSPDAPISSTNKTDCHNIAEILLKAPLSGVKHHNSNPTLIQLSFICYWHVEVHLVFSWKLNFQQLNETLNYAYYEKLFEESKILRIICCAFYKNRL